MSFRFLLTGMLMTFLMIFAGDARAVELSLTSERVEVGIGQRMEVSVHVDSEGEQVNAIEAVIDIPEGIVVESVRDGNALITFWAERPRAGGDTIRFSGIIPGGWMGTEGYLFSFVIETISEGMQEFELQDVRVFLNDGKGTALTTSVQGLTLSVDALVPVADILEAIVDIEAPEEFTPHIAQDETVFEGKYFLAFATQDKASGIDHYEIVESKRALADIGDEGWHIVTSPYRIADQTLRTNIYLRAVDKVGNIRVVVYEPEIRPEEKPPDQQAARTRIILLTLGLLFILVLLIFITIGRSKKLPR